MDKKSLTEADIRTKFITPAILGPDGSKWNVMTQMREEVQFTKGRVIVRGKTVRRGDLQLGIAWVDCPFGNDKQMIAALGGERIIPAEQVQEDES